MSFHVPNRYGTDDSLGNNGAFFLPNSRARGAERQVPLKIIASDGLLVPEEDSALAGWEHVSVSLPSRCPTWEEMAHVKATFWDAEDCVVQFHPPESEYVNNHSFCLHLWRWLYGTFPMPPTALVGYRSAGGIA